MELHQKYFNQRKWYFGELPEQIMVETAMACNLRCEMCPVPRHEETMLGRKSSIMSLYTYQRILDAVSNKQRSLHLNQMGEPLLNKHICEFVALSKGYGHVVSFTTNGTLMNTNLSKELLNAGLDRIIFSVDGSNPKTYENIRKGANYEKVCSSIESFYLLKKKLNKSTLVQIDCILSDLTKDEISSMQEYWKDRIDFFNVISLDDWAGKLELPNEFGKRNWLPREEENSDIRYPCDLLWTTLAISAEGNAMYCCHDYKLQSNLPNISDVPLKVIWKEYISKERKKHVNNKIDGNPCLNCDAWKTRQSHFGKDYLLRRLLPAKLKIIIKRMIKSITNKEYQALFGISRITATRDFKLLEGKGILERIGKGKRNLKYVLK